MSLIQIIKENDQPKFAVIQWDLFMKFREQFEEFEDYLDAKKLLNDPITETVTLNIYDFIKNPVKAIRIENGLTQKQLAEIMNVSQPYIAKVEKSKKLSQKFIFKVKEVLQDQS